MIPPFSQGLFKKACFVYYILTINICHIDSTNTLGLKKLEPSHFCEGPSL